MITTNLIDLSHRTREVIDELNEELKSVGVSLIIQSDSAKTMESNIDQIISLAVTGGLLAILILWFFLSNIQLVLAVALSIPISVYAAFTPFYAFGISINSLTLVGMALAIVCCLTTVLWYSKIFTDWRTGVSIREAVLRGTREVWRSVFAATLTTIAVFLRFLHFRCCGKTIRAANSISIVGTLGISFLVAMLLFLCSRT
jgi:multidrug efflux pump subunit AcrB